VCDTDSAQATDTRTDNSGSDGLNADAKGLTHPSMFDGSEESAGMAELADAADSKSAEGNLVGVRPPLPAPR
jgi:hypothetical protein